MTGYDAPRSVEEGSHTHTHNGSTSHSPCTGADTPVYLALLQPSTSQPNGELLEDRKVTSFM